jgi:hypothetical protein
MPTVIEGAADAAAADFGYIVVAAALLLLLYIALSYVVYRRAFVPLKPSVLDDFAFTPFEFQADSEEVELVTADKINFGAWHFRQPGSPQTVIVSGGQRSLDRHLRHQGGPRAAGGHRVRAQAHPECEDRAPRLFDGRGGVTARRGGRARC